MEPDSGSRETGRYGQSHRNRHSEDAYRGGSRAQAGTHRLGHRHDRRHQPLPSGEGRSDRHPRRGQYGRTRVADQTPERIARKPRRSEGKSCIGRNHRVREDQERQSARIGRRSRQSPRIIG